MKKGLRRVAFVAVSTLVAIPAMAAIASANSTFAFDRVAGTDRYGTSVATAKVFGDSANLILASGVKGHFPDALAASYLAGRKNAPVMLTTLNTTPTNIAAQIAARGTKNIWIVGGTGVVSAAQQAALATKYTVKRLGGGDRYITAAAVIADGGVSASTTAVLATGQDFPDALGGGALSYAKGMPLAITKTDVLPAETLKALKDAGITNVIILGGPTVVTANVVTALTTAGITSSRIFGLDRAETSSKLADFEITNEGFTNTAVNVASGYRAGDGVDALGGAAVSGKELRPLLITDNQSLVGPGVEAFLKAHSATLAKGHIFGGTGALTAAAEATMTADAKSVVSNQTFSVTPSATAVVPFGAASATTTRTYTATVPAGTVVDIGLFAADNVTVSTSGVVTFVDADATPNVADVGTLGTATITSVNGIANGGPIANNVTSTGTITFTVSSPSSAVSVRPVVFAHSATNVLDLVVPATANANPKEPSVAFGVGGVTIFTPAQAPLGTTSIVVGTADTANHFIANGNTFFYDANDVFQFSGIVITLAQFESIISANDHVTVIYNPNPAGVSTFNVTIDSIGTLAAPSVVVVNLDAGTTINDVKVTFSPATDASSGTTYKLLDAGVVVAGATLADGPVAGTLVFTALNVPNGAHTYAIRATNPVSAATATSGTTAATTPGVADVTGPGSIFLTQTNGATGLSGTLDSADTIKVVFNEPMAAPSAGDKIRFTDGDGTIVDVTCGTNATCTRNAAAEIVGGTSRPADTVLTLVLTADPTVITAGTVAGEQVASGAVTDQAGNTDTSGNAWDLTAAVSTDKTLA